MFTSLDGYTEDGHGGFGWGAPEDEELHSCINELASPFGTYLYGRTMYETMVYWETGHTVRDQPQFMLDFAAVAGGGEDRRPQDSRRATHCADEDRA
jgi:hypothetical protein